PGPSSILLPSDAGFVSLANPTTVLGGSTGIVRGMDTCLRIYPYGRSDPRLHTGVPDMTRRDLPPARGVIGRSGSGRCPRRGHLPGRSGDVGPPPIHPPDSSRSPERGTGAVTARTRWHPPGPDDVDGGETWGRTRGAVSSGPLADGQNAGTPVTGDRSRTSRASSRASALAQPRTHTTGTRARAGRRTLPRPSGDRIPPLRSGENTQPLHGPEPGGRRRRHRRDPGRNLARCRHERTRNTDRKSVV